MLSDIYELNQKNIIPQRANLHYIINLLKNTIYLIKC